MVRYDIKIESTFQPSLLFINHPIGDGWIFLIEFKLLYFHKFVDHDG